MLNGEYIFGLGTKVAVEETDKMYKMTLVSLDMADWCPHIEMMFHHDIGDAVYFRKRHGKHAVYDWGDDTFTIYPFKAGIPYYFEKRNDGTKIILYHNSRLQTKEPRQANISGTRRKQTRSPKEI